MGRKQVRRVEFMRDEHRREREQSRDIERPGRWSTGWTASDWFIAPMTTTCPQPSMLTLSWSCLDEGREEVAGEPWDARRR